MLQEYRRRKETKSAGENRCVRQAFLRRLSRETASFGGFALARGGAAEVAEGKVLGRPVPRVSKLQSTVIILKNTKLRLP